MSDMRDALDALVGSTMLGGCDDCHAEQTMRRDESGVYVLQIAHDPTCPTLRKMERRRRR